MANIIFNQIESAHRDTLLGKARGADFEELVTSYGFPRPGWIPVKHWRQAVRVALINRRGTFHTLKAFFQAALAGYMLEFSYVHEQPYTDLDYISRYPGGAELEEFNFRKRITELFGNSLSEVGNSRHVITLKSPNNALLRQYCAFGGLTRSFVGREIILQGRDKQWRTHRIIYDAFNKRGEVTLVLEPTTNGYTSGFPVDTWAPVRNHEPFFKEPTELNDPSPYYATEGELFDIDADQERADTLGKGYLLPFTLTEPSPGVSRSRSAYSDPNESVVRGRRILPRKSTTWGLMNRCRVRLNLYIVPNTEGWTEPWTYLISGGDPVVWGLHPNGLAYQVVDDLNIYQDNFETVWPTIAADDVGGNIVHNPRPGAAEHGKLKPEGHLYGGQLLRSEFDGGNPIAQDGTVGRAPGDENSVNGPHPPYFPGLGSGFITDSFMFGLKFLMPVGYWLEVNEGADAMYRSIEECEEPQAVPRRPLWGRDGNIFNLSDPDSFIVSAGGFDGNGLPIPTQIVNEQIDDANRRRGLWSDWDMPQGGLEGMSSTREVPDINLILNNRRMRANASVLRNPTMFSTMSTIRILD